MRKIIDSIAGEYRRYKALGEGAMRQLTEAQLAERAPGEGNSVTTLVWHMAGNLKSRFTDFLTSDGEKSWRDRDTEFEARRASADELFAKWEDGWQALRSALDALSDEDLDRQVLIRGQPLSVIEALQRSLTHASYHVGQIVFLAKSLRGAEWQYLTIPPGTSRQYNERPTLERGPRKDTR